MDGLFLLYLITFVPIASSGSPSKYMAITKGRDALFIQIGIKQDWDRVKENVEKSVDPKTKRLLGYGASTYHIVSQKKLEVRLNTITINAGTRVISVGWQFSF